MQFQTGIRIISELHRTSVLFGIGTAGTAVLFGIRTTGTAVLFGIEPRRTALIFMQVLASTRLFMQFRQFMQFWNRIELLEPQKPLELRVLANFCEIRTAGTAKTAKPAGIGTAGITKFFGIRTAGTEKLAVIRSAGTAGIAHAYYSVIFSL